MSVTEFKLIFWESKRIFWIAVDRLTTSNVNLALHKYHLLPNERLLTVHLHELNKKKLVWSFNLARAADISKTYVTFVNS